MKPYFYLLIWFLIQNFNENYLSSEKEKAIWNGDCQCQYVKNILHRIRYKYYVLKYNIKNKK